MSSSLIGAIGIPGIAMKVAAHIPARNSQVPHDGNHGVRKILTNALARPDGFLHGRIDPCAALYVKKYWLILEFRVVSSSKGSRLPRSTTSRAFASSSTSGEVQAKRLGISISQ